MNMTILVKQVLLVYISGERLHDPWSSGSTDWFSEVVYDCHITGKRSSKVNCDHDKGLPDLQTETTETIQKNTGKPETC